MGHADSDELITLCEEILEDNEVTVEEILGLGEWLNNHEGARWDWPGNLLAPTIQEVLLDDKVSNAELRKVEGLLRRTLKEYVLREKGKLQQRAAEKVQQAAKAMDLSQPKLPSISLTLNIKSHGSGNLSYEVDLTGPSCNCPDWRNRRVGLPPGDLNRCCKHVLDAFNYITPDHGWPGWLGAFLEQRWTPHPLRKWRVLPVVGHYTLVSIGGNDWADVYTYAEGRYQRFGYNFAEARWSYGIAPTGATEIENAMAPESTRKGAKKAIAGLLERLFGSLFLI